MGEWLAIVADNRVANHCECTHNMLHMLRLYGVAGGGRSWGLIRHPGTAEATRTKGFGGAGG